LPLPPNRSSALRVVSAVDHHRLQSIENILLNTIEDMRWSHDARQQDPRAAAVGREYKDGYSMQDDDEDDGDSSRKRSRRQNHKNEQKNVLMDWFFMHELDPYPNNDEKLYLARVSGLEVRQVEHCESAPAPLSAPMPLCLHASLPLPSLPLPFGCRVYVAPGACHA